MWNRYSLQRTMDSMGIGLKFLHHWIFQWMRYLLEDLRYTSSRSGVANNNFNGSYPGGTVWGQDNQWKMGNQCVLGMGGRFRKRCVLLSLESPKVWNIWEEKSYQNVLYLNIRFIEKEVHQILKKNIMASRKVLEVQEDTIHLPKIF